MSEPLIAAILKDSEGPLRAAMLESRGRIRRRRKVRIATAASAVLLAVFAWISVFAPSPQPASRSAISRFSTDDFPRSISEFSSESVGAGIPQFSSGEVQWAFREIDEPTLLHLLADYRPVVVRLNDHARLVLTSEP